MNKLSRLILIVFIISVCGLSHAETNEKGKNLLLQKREENLRKQQGLPLQEIKAQPDTATTMSSQESDLRVVETIPIRKDAEDIILDKSTFRPKAYITKEEIDFVDSQGREKRKYVFENEHTDVITAQGDKYIGVTAWLKTGPKYELEDAKFTMLDDEGNIKWEVNHRFYRCFPSPDGTFAIGITDPEGDVILYLIDASGNKKQISESGPNRSFGPNFNISTNGEIIAISIRSLTRNPGKCLFVVLDKTGKELWRKNSENKSLIGSPSEKYIAIVATDNNTKENTLSMYDIGGNLLWEYAPYTGSGDLIFSEDSKYLFSICEMYETSSGKQLWKNAAITGSNVVTTPALNFILIRGGKFEKINVRPGIQKKYDYFYLISKDGEILLYKEFSPGFLIIRGTQPTIKISPTGDNISIETAEGLKIFKNPVIGK